MKLFIHGLIAIFLISQITLLQSLNSPVQQRTVQSESSCSSKQAQADQTSRSNQTKQCTAKYACASCCYLHSDQPGNLRIAFSQDISVYKFIIIEYDKTRLLRPPQYV